MMGGTVSSVQVFESINVYLPFDQEDMKFICFTLLFVCGITDSRSEQYKVVGPTGPVFVLSGEDVILPCLVKPNTSVVDMRVEWFRPDLKD
ncbi:hypothetical protein QQF64_025704 [Cirrhinus molitorella]|uniref:Uncharacterized protein n=1 Tax=Cirrhinus molitorella TaxID=172907 RepID=A0ABR3NQI0_9TELE